MSQADTETITTGVGVRAKAFFEMESKICDIAHMASLIVTLEPLVNR
jgi:hypothetical protein